MADYGNHKPHMADYSRTSPGGTWIWVAVVAAALVLLLFVIMAGSGGPTTVVQPDGTTAPAVQPLDGEATVPAADPVLPDATGTAIDQ